MDGTPGKDRMRWCGAAWASILRVAIVVCVLDSTHSVDEHTSSTNAHLRLGSDVIATARQLLADSSHCAGAKPYPASRLCETVRLRGGDASWGQDAAEDGYHSSEMRESVATSEMGSSLRPSQLDLSDGPAADADGNQTDPALLAQRYYALPASSRQLLDDLVRFKWKQATNESGGTETELQPHDKDTEPLTGMKLEAVWEGDEQLCVRVAEAHPQSGVQAGDLVKTVEGIDCSKKSIAEVGHLIAQANAMKISVHIGMLRNSIYSQAGTEETASTQEAGGEGDAKRAEHVYSLTLERGWLLTDENSKVEAVCVCVCARARVRLAGERPLASESPHAPHPRPREAPCCKAAQQRVSHRRRTLLPPLPQPLPPCLPLPCLYPCPSPAPTLRRVPAQTCHGRRLTERGKTHACARAHTQAREAEEREAEAVEVLKSWGVWPLTSHKT